MSGKTAPERRGAGTALVASEVKALAGQTARATEEIKGQIDAVQATTGEAVAANGPVEIIPPQPVGVASTEAR